MITSLSSFEGGGDNSDEEEEEEDEKLDGRNTWSVALYFATTSELHVHLNTVLHANDIIVCQGAAENEISFKQPMEAKKQMR